MYEIAGTIKLIYDTQSFNSGFTKREFVITTDDKYPQDVKLELIKDRTALLDDFTQGDVVNVGFYVRGNEYKEKYYVNLQANKVERASGGGSSGGDSAMNPSDEPAEDAEGDFPF